MKIEVKLTNEHKWGLFVNDQCIGDAKLRCDADLAAHILQRAVDEDKCSTSQQGTYQTSPK